MKKKMISFKVKPLYVTLGVIILLIIWESLAYILKTPLFPSVEATFISLGALLIDASLFEAIGGTLFRLLLSFLFSFIFAGVFGILAGLFKRVRYILSPIVLTFRTLPVAAIVYVLIALLSPKTAPYFILFLSTFPILYEAFASGIESIDNNTLDSLRLEGIHNFRSVFQVMVPMSSSYIILGVIQSLSLGMKVSIMAEILTGSESLSGLGRLIYWASYNVEMNKVFALSIISIFIMGVFEALLFYIKKYLKNKEKH